jgi:hypothetical protein
VGRATNIRLAEVVGSLSLAADLATGQALEHGLRRTLVAVWLGDALGLALRDLGDRYRPACGRPHRDWRNDRDRRRHESDRWLGENVDNLLGTLGDCRRRYCRPNRVNDWGVGWNDIHQ